MLAARAVALLALAQVAATGHYGFYRDMAGRGAGGARRVFGGRGAAWGAGAACALLDRYWAARCSGAALAPRWALTAAHCVSPRLAYVLYDAGAAAPVHRLYRHPRYRAVQEESDVTLLHHDVGLVHTRTAMRPPTPPPPLRALARYDAADLAGEEVEVFGFGRTEGSAAGERPYAARLRVVACERATWQHCVCARGAAEGAGGDAGVCAGDSGGPVLYRGVQVGVTSMGPLECAAGGGPAGGRAASVVTALARYAALINATVREAEAALRMERVSRSPPRASPASVPLVLASCAARLLAGH